MDKRYVYFLSGSIETTDVENNTYISNDNFEVKVSELITQFNTIKDLEAELEKKLKSGVLDRIGAVVEVRVTINNFILLRTEEVEEN